MIDNDANLTAAQREAILAVYRKAIHSFDH